MGVLRCCAPGHAAHRGDLGAQSNILPPKAEDFVSFQRLREAVELRGRYVILTLLIVGVGHDELCGRMRCLQRSEAIHPKIMQDLPGAIAHSVLLVQLFSSSQICS